MAAERTIAEPSAHPRRISPAKPEGVVSPQSHMILGPVLGTPLVKKPGKFRTDITGHSPERRGALQTESRVPAGPDKRFRGTGISDDPEKHHERLAAVVLLTDKLAEPERQVGSGDAPQFPVQTATVSVPKTSTHPGQRLRRSRYQPGGPLPETGQQEGYRLKIADGTKTVKNRPSEVAVFGKGCDHRHRHRPADGGNGLKNGIAEPEGRTFQRPDEGSERFRRSLPAQTLRRSAGHIQVRVCQQRLKYRARCLVADHPENVDDELAGITVRIPERRYQDRQRRIPQGNESFDGSIAQPCIGLGTEGSHQHPDEFAIVASRKERTGCLLADPPARVSQGRS